MIFAATHGAVITIGLILTFFRVKPHILFAATALILAFGAAAGYGTIWATGQAPERSLHDTYLIVSHFHQLLSLAMIWGLLAVAHWGQARFEALYWPGLTIAAFWALVLGMSANVLVMTAIPSLIDLIGTGTAFRVTGRAFQVLSILRGLGFLMITALLIASFVRRWRRQAV